MAMVSYFCKRLLLMALLATIVSVSSGQSFALAQEETEEAEEVVTDRYSFPDMGFSEQLLRGPYDATTYSFSLPADWQLAEGAELRFEVSTTLLEQGVEVSERPAGSLSVSFNDERLSTTGLISGSAQEIVGPLTGEALTLTDDGRYNVSLLLDSGNECTDGRQIEVRIRDTSSYVLPYSEITPTLDLTALPRPFYQRTFLPESAIIVVPDQPTDTELQALLITAAGIGRTTSNRLPLTLRRASDLTRDEYSGSNLIFIGKPGGLPLLADIDLPVSVADGAFASPELMPDDGIVQVAPSPWKKGGSVLVIGGNSDGGLIKASQAFAARQLLVGEDRTVSLIAEVIAPEPLNDITESRTFTDLGYKARRIGGVGSTAITYDFFLPEDQSLDDEAYLDLAFAHSSLLDPNQSNISVSLNGVDIGGVSLSSQDIEQNVVRIPIPRSIGQPGRNQLNIRANLVPLSQCVDRDTIDVWATLLPESLLQLPLTPARPFTIRSLSIGEYPTPFTRSPSLSTLAIVLSASDPTGWETALRVVGDLGSRATGSLLYLTAAYADNISDTIRQDRDLLVIGRPSTLPIIAEMNDDLAAPFEPGSDRAINRRTQVVFRTGADLEEGYLELLRAPWNNQRVVLSILGTSEQSISWAAQALTNPDLRSRLGGSFALIVDEQVFIGGTLPTIATQPTDTAGVSGQPSTITETVEIGTQFPDARPPSGTASLLIPLVISMGAMLLVIGGVIGVMWLRRRKGSKP